MEISAYKTDDEKDVLTAIKQDPNWDIFTNINARDSYKSSLINSVTYVCRHNAEFAGYIRAVLDKNIAIYISELYVVPRWRNKNVARNLLAKVKADFSELPVYVLSDEDAYYEKLNCKKAGSVFQL